MSTQSKIELALSLWTNGDNEGFKKIIQEEKDNIVNYKDRGDVWTYFMPALLLKGFWEQMQEAGFPMEKIVYSHRDVLGWLAWPRAVEYMRFVDPSFISSIYEYGVDECTAFIDERNYEITMDYYNTDLRFMVEEAIDQYQNMSDEEWDDILDKLG